MVGAGELRCEDPADRTDEQDAPSGLAQQGQHGLGGGDLSDHVDLELAAQVVQRQHLQRPGKADARVVDQSVQPAAGEVARDLVDGRVDRGGQRYVEDDDAKAPDAPARVAVSATSSTPAKT